MLPFILATSVMFGLEYIMLSLLGNDYIQKRHSELPLFIRYANVLIGFLSVIFIIYANRFVIRQRRQEFAVNRVLGMESKHISLILFFESLIQFVIIALISVVGGYLFGNLIFMILNRLVKDSGTTLMDYPFDTKAAMILLLMLGITMIVLFIINVLRVVTQSPLSLMRSKNAGEKKSRKWLVIILAALGLAGLVNGYTIALSTQGVLNSLSTVFKAAFIVTISTYLLFMSFIILVLQFLQKVPNIYYKSDNFISISGMLSRMRANSIGLASITMLCTFLIVTLGMSVVAYQGIENQVEAALTHDYEINVTAPDKNQMQKKVNAVDQDIRKIVDIDKLRQSPQKMMATYIEGNHFEVFKDPKVQSNNDKMLFVVVTTEKGHNDLHDEHINLRQNEVVYSTNAKRFSRFNQLQIMKQYFKAERIEERYIPSNIGVDAMYLVVKDEKEYKDILKYYEASNMSGEGEDIDNTLAFNVNGDKKAFDQQIKKLEKKHDISITSKQIQEKMIYELNGGLIFIGVVVAIILLAGMFLILYYKQLSEGYEDKKNYHIMKQVGLPDELIRKTINKQVFWIFALPILTAIIHTAFASKIIYQLMGLLGIRDIPLFLTSYIGVALIIMLIYGLMYWMTSRTYYEIIKSE